MLENGTLVAERYEIIEKIGIGGMANVYKAQDIKLSRTVAVKVLKDEFSEDMTFVNKFRTEAQSAAGLEHPNIVNVYDVGSENGFYYIVMEYVEGITLKDYIKKKGHLSYKEALSITIQVGRGLQAAHEKNIIHRDVKPQNIIISTDGKVKVTDFGIARAATSNTIHSDVMGSVHYASPEQARNGYVSNRSDIYSLGIVMYEMVTGRVPYDGDSTVQIAIQHLQDEMVPPSEYVDDLPISLEKIIMKCTQKSPDRRYESMENLLLDLRKALINPNEDFVTYAPVGNETRIISEDELKQIQDRSEDSSEPVYYTDTSKDVVEKRKKNGRNNKGDRTEKTVTILGIIAAIVIVVIVILLLGNVFGWFHFGSEPKQETPVISVISEEPEEKEETITLEDLSGMSFSDAEKKLSDAGLVLKENGTKSSDEYDEGEIIEQDPKAGTKLKKGDTVSVIVSTGEAKEQVTVPDVKGIDEESAVSHLESRGFKVNKEYSYSDTVGSGEVFAQDPKANTKAGKGDTVTIQISQGGERVQVPNVKGSSLADAKSALSSAGLKYNESEEYSDSVSEGNIISQSVAAGEYVTRGSSVTIVVSKGPESKKYSYQGKVEAPDNMSVEKAEIALYQSGKDDPIKEYTVTTFPYPFFVNGIEGSEDGTLVITWYYKDDSGNIQTTVDEQPVKFTQK